MVFIHCVRTPSLILGTIFANVLWFLRHDAKDHDSTAKFEKETLKRSVLTFTGHIQSNAARQGHLARPSQGKREARSAARTCWQCSTLALTCASAEYPGTLIQGQSASPEAPLQHLLHLEHTDNTPMLKRMERSRRET